MLCRQASPVYTLCGRQAPARQSNVNGFDEARSFKRDVTPPLEGGAPPSTLRSNNISRVLYRVLSVFLLLLVTLYRSAYSVESEASESVL